MRTGTWYGSFLYEKGVRQVFANHRFHTCTTLWRKPARPLFLNVVMDLSIKRSEEMRTGTWYGPFLYEKGVRQVFANHGFHTCMTLWRKPARPLFPLAPLQDTASPFRPALESLQYGEPKMAVERIQSMKQRLFSPGPTPVPEETLLELAKPIIHHRSPEFREILAEVLDGMQYVYRTRNQVIPLSSSGTGGMEAATVNCLYPGAKAICLIAGRFGERWRSLCKAFGAEPISVVVPYGQVVTPEQLAKALAEHPDAVAVYATLCETATGSAMTSRPSARSLPRRRQFWSWTRSVVSAPWNAVPTIGGSTCA